MMNVYVGDSVFSIPLTRWVKFRAFLLTQVDDLTDYKYVCDMMYYHVLSSEILPDAISQLELFMTKYDQFNDILKPLNRLLINANNGNKDVGFGVVG